MGGAIVQIDDQTHHNHLDFLYVDTAHQNKGISYKIWTALEQKYPQFFGRHVPRILINETFIFISIVVALLL